MVTSLTGDALVLVALIGFYGGLARDLGATTELLAPRLGLGLALAPYVAGGVAALLALATVAAEVVGAGSGLAGAAPAAVGLCLLFAVAFWLFFRLGTAVYSLLLRLGLDLTRN